MSWSLPRKRSSVSSFPWVSPLPRATSPARGLNNGSPAGSGLETPAPAKTTNWLSFWASNNCLGKSIPLIFIGIRHLPSHLCSAVNRFLVLVRRPELPFLRVGVEYFLLVVCSGTPHSLNCWETMGYLVPTILPGRGRNHGLSYQWLLSMVVRQVRSPSSGPCRWGRMTNLRA